jgi:hypothetical protein
MRMYSHTFTIVLGTAAYHTYHSQDFHVIIGTELHIVELIHTTYRTYHFMILYCREMRHVHTHHS